MQHNSYAIRTSTGETKTKTGVNNTVIQREGIALFLRIPQGVPKVTEKGRGEKAREEGRRREGESRKERHRVGGGELAKSWLESSAGNSREKISGVGERVGTEMI
jgi:hypothetical protein